MEQVVIIGNGVAAVSAMEAFRERDKSTPIIVISEEPYLAYHRTRLSGFLGSNTNIEKLLLHPPNWYEEKNIHIRHDKKVTSIDNMNKLVTLDKGEMLNFSKLLICTGSSAFVPAIPGADLPGVFSIRTLDDIKNFYEFCKDKTNGVIIGGGVLGLEAAWALVNQGKKITIIERSSYILRKQLNKTASEILASLGKKAGIDFVFEKQLAKVKGHNDVSHIVLEDGHKIPADFVIFSTGVRSNIECAKDLVDVNRGIIVDEYMQTSAEDIYAAGDVAEYQGQIYGIWPVAKEQGRIAGLNLSGIRTTYKEVLPSNFLRVFDKDIYSVGNPFNDRDIETIMEKIEPNKNIYQAVYIQNQTPVGAILLGNTEPALKISKAIKSKTKLSINNYDMDFESFLKNI